MNSILTNRDRHKKRSIENAPFKKNLQPIVNQGDTHYVSP